MLRALQILSAAGCIVALVGVATGVYVKALGALFSHSRPSSQNPPHPREVARRWAVALLPFWLKTGVVSAVLLGVATLANRG